MICKYCKKEFKTKSSLNLHIKTAKYCLQIQTDLGLINNVNSDEYKCFICNKFLSHKNSLLVHLKSCTTLYNFNLLLKNKNDMLDNLLNENIKHKQTIKLLENNLKLLEYKLKDEPERIIYLEKENNILKDENNILKGENNILKGDHECIQNIAKQPKHTNTNIKTLNIISPLDLSSTDIIKNMINDKYKLDYIFSGQKGIARFEIDHILKDDEGNLKYVCTDPSRHIFKYKDETGEIRKDIEAKKLTNFLVEGGIKNKASNIMNDWWTEETGITNTDKFELLVDKAESLRTIDTDNNEFKKELATMTTV